MAYKLGVLATVPFLDLGRRSAVQGVQASGVRLSLALAVGVRPLVWLVEPAAGDPAVAATRAKYVSGIDALTGELAVRTGALMFFFLFFFFLLSGARDFVTISRPSGAFIPLMILIIITQAVVLFFPRSIIFFLRPPLRSALPTKPRS